MTPQSNSEAWKKLVLRSMPAPAWLGVDAPLGDIVISSRVRIARNLRGYPFPHHASSHQLLDVLRSVRKATENCPIPLVANSTVTEAERDFLLGSRLLSPEFPHRDPGRAIILDNSRMVSVMVNEEDHIRLQALSAGYSIRTAEGAAQDVLVHLDSQLDFMRAEPWGYLTASPTNLGAGMRRSALFHLIGLAHTKRLPSVIRALTAWGITARGLYGESSRAVGAFFQVSTTHASLPEFMGACEYLIDEEQRSRREVGRLELEERSGQAAEFAIMSTEISLADALRVLGWVRWASSATLPGFPKSARIVDTWIATIEVHGTQQAKIADRHRASFLRTCLESERNLKPKPS